jgi:glycosyltransferase involved in cell wall biosynthesis
MRIASITAGAAGMYCGSCLRDNALAAALNEIGHETLLLPTYTPIRTDEPDMSRGPIFFGGVNVYLRQKFRLFRWTPWWLDRLFSSRWLLKLVSRFAMSVRAEELGKLTVSMLEGEHGVQIKGVDELARWLTEKWKPDVIVLTNVLLSGVVPELKRRVGVPVVATLQGDDIFLESLPAEYKQRCLELIRENCAGVDGYVATCRYYADFMAGYLGLPRDKFHVVYPGINLAGFNVASPARTQDEPVIGYFARIAPEKGLHVLADAFIHLRKQPDAPRAKLRFAGWLGAHNRGYLAGVWKKLNDAGLAGDVEHADAPTHADKVRFLHGIDVLSVPAPYREPKGLYVLEALAAGVPVVQPRHGSFPELIDATGGGLLANPDDPADIAAGLRRLLEDVELRRELGGKGQAAVREKFTAERMARDTAALLQNVITTRQAVP